MMEALMYGIMPNEKTENCSKAPPEKRLRNPNSVPFCCSKKAAMAWRSIPGVGTCTPRRYTASIASVNNTRRRSSGTREAFWKPLSMTCYQFNLSAGRFYLLFRFSRKSMGFDRQWFRQRAIAQNLDPLVFTVYQTMLSQQLR